MKFRKKPIEIEAMQLKEGNENELISWAHKGFPPETNSILIRGIGGLSVRTLEGHLMACYGDWIIKGVKGEFYPCKPDIFEQTYELCGDDEAKDVLEKHKALGEGKEK